MGSTGSPQVHDQGHLMLETRSGEGGNEVREGEARLASPRTGVRNRTAPGRSVLPAFGCAECSFLTELSQTVRDFGHHNGPGKGPVSQSLLGPGQTQELAGLLLREVRQSCRWSMKRARRCGGNWVICPRPARSLGSHAGPMARMGTGKGLRMCVWGNYRFITAKATFCIP